MNRYFADTFYFLAILNPNDPYFEKAMLFNKRMQGRLSTSMWVMMEVADALAASANRTLFVRLLDRLEHNPCVSIVPFEDSIFREGLKLYQQRNDKKWSLTDCISFSIMQEEGIREALTGDRHFEQAGFVALLK